VTVSLEEVRRTLGVPGPGDHAAWEQVRELLIERVGRSAFEIWLTDVQIVAVDAEGALLLDAGGELRCWVRQRYGGVIAECATRANAAVRFASEAQSVAMAAQ